MTRRRHRTKPLPRILTMVRRRHRTMLLPRILTTVLPREPTIVRDIDRAALGSLVA
jgi:hypothetical protein